MIKFLKKKNTNVSLDLAYDLLQKDDGVEEDIIIKFNESLNNIFLNENNEIKILSNITVEQKNNLKKYIIQILEKGGEPKKYFNDYLNKKIPVIYNKRNPEIEEGNNNGNILNEKISELKDLFFGDENNIFSLVQNLRNIYELNEEDYDYEKIKDCLIKANYNFALAYSLLSKDDF